MLNGIRPLTNRRIREALFSLGDGIELVREYAAIAVPRILTIGFVVIAGYLSNRYLLPILPHSFTLKWYEAAVVLVLAIVGMGASHTLFFTELWNDGGLAAIIVGSIGFATAGYFLTDNPPALHWEILTVAIAAFTAFVIGAAGEWMVSDD